MGASTLLRNRPFVLAVFTAVALMAAILWAELATASDPEVNVLVTDSAGVLCAAIASAMYIWAYASMTGRDLSRRVWGLVAMGIVLWTVAEAIWAYDELIRGIESPYPGMADAFWLAGYVPIIVALVAKYRSFGGARRWRSRPTVIVVILVYGALIIPFVFWPIVGDFDTSRLLESLVSTAYPVADSVLCVLSIVIIFALERGRFADAWRLFGAGMVLSAIADSLFAYLSWNGLYYPEGQITALSLTDDALFNVQYLLLAIAILTYVLRARGIREGEFRLVLQRLEAPLNKMETLIFVNPQGRILLASDNLGNLVGTSERKQWVGMDLANAFGMDAQRMHAVVDEIVKRGSVTGQPMSFQDFDHREKSASLSALAVRDREMNLNMVVLILLSPLPANEVVPPLTDQQRMWVDHFLQEAGTASAEEKNTIGAYLVAQVNLLYSLLLQFTGKESADRLLEHLSQSAQEQHWFFASTGLEIILPETLQGEELVRVVEGLLQAARRYAADATDRGMIEQESMGLDARLAPKSRAVIEKSGLGVREWVAA